MSCSESYLFGVIPSMISEADVCFWVAPQGYGYNIDPWVLTDIGGDISLCALVQANQNIA